MIHYTRAGVFDRYAKYVSCVTEIHFLLWYINTRFSLNIIAQQIAIIGNIVRREPKRRSPDKIILDEASSEFITGLRT